MPLNKETNLVIMMLVDPIYAWGAPSTNNVRGPQVLIVLGGLSTNGVNEGKYFILFTVMGICKWFLEWGGKITPHQRCMYLPSSPSTSKMQH